MRPYADRMMELMIGTARASSSVRGLPLLQRREEEHDVAILPLTGDRGLAGAFNSQVLRHAFALGRQLEGEGSVVRWLVSGRKGASTLRFRRFEVLQAWTGFSDRPAYADAQALAHKVEELYVGEEVDRIVLVYNHFVSPLVQEVVEQEVLPIPEQRAGGGRRGAVRRLCSATSSTSPSRSRSSSGCYPSTSRPSSTVRCSSRPPPSRARG